MIVKDIHWCIETFSRLFNSENGFEAEYSRAWHPNQSKNDPILELDAASGVYIYSAPGKPEWDLPISENTNDIWYIGKSRRSVRARVWHNLGSLCEPDGSICSPRFKYQRWATDESIKNDAVKTAISNGDFVAYSIAINPISATFAPEILEIFLQTCFYRSKGTLPILNSIISQYKVPH